MPSRRHRRVLLRARYFRSGRTGGTQKLPLVNSRRFVPSYYPNRVIEKRFQIPFVAELALREKQIQQNYRPIIAVHKWFARRPGTLFRSILLSEFGDQPVEDTYYRANSFEGVTIADPFMGGGTPLLEANRLGCNVIGTDISPMP